MATTREYSELVHKQEARIKALSEQLVEAGQSEEVGRLRTRVAELNTETHRLDSALQHATADAADARAECDKLRVRRQPRCAVAAV
jgi:hypothetical protein